MLVLLLILSMFLKNVNGYKIGPVSITTKTVKRVGDVKVYEPFYSDEKNAAVVFFTGASGLIPDNIYTNVLSHLASMNVTSYIYNKKYDCDRVIDYLKENHSNVSLVGHSSGCMKAINYAKKSEDINALILFDPVDDTSIYEDKIEMIFNLFFNKENRYSTKLESLKKCLFVKSKKSYDWGLRPFKTPFIPAFDLKPKDLDIPNGRKKELVLEKYGHSDILDSYWSEIMHNSIDEGFEERSAESINCYHYFLARVIKSSIDDDLHRLIKLMHIDEVCKKIDYKYISH